MTYVIVDLNEKVIFLYCTMCSVQLSEDDMICLGDLIKNMQQGMVHF